MQKDTAIAFIVSKVKTVYGDTNISEGALNFYVEKLVNDVLSYCHRHDFPEPLLFICVDLIMKRLKDEEAEANGDGDLKSLKMDDTTFEFNTVGKINIGVLKVKHRGQKFLLNADKAFKYPTHQEISVRKVSEAGWA